MPIIGICKDAFGTYFLTYLSKDTFFTAHEIYLSNIIDKNGNINNGFLGVRKLQRREAIQIAKRLFPNCTKYEISAMGHEIIKKIK